MPIGRQVDRVLETLKWPIAWLSAAMVVPLSYATIRLALRAFFFPRALAFIVSGILLYSLVWRPFGRKRWKTDWLLNVEHELTHALFAILTFHRIKSFQVTRTGGKVEVIGGSNWLIALAPYFFPTAPLCLLFLSLLMPLASVLPWTGLFLGFAMAYHVRSTWIETHGAQTDFKQAGKKFSVVFLPSANLIAFGTIASFGIDGWDGVTAFWGDAIEAVRWICDWVWTQMSNLLDLFDSGSEESSNVLPDRSVGTDPIAEPIGSEPASNESVSPEPQQDD